MTLVCTLVQRCTMCGNAMHVVCDKDSCIMRLQLHIYNVKQKKQLYSQIKHLTE